MIQSIEIGRKEDGNRSIADKIIKRIHDLEKTVENNYGRWAWELLQNAKDSVADDTKEVDVFLTFNGKEVNFMHNGNHFTEQDIRGLINQISSKEVEAGRKSSRVGRFGTGFITTHLLSKIVHVKGIIETQSNELHKFEFTLDREGKTTSILAPKIESTWNHFQNSEEKIISVDNNQFNTIFTYPIISEKQKNIAKRGIDEFSKLMPYVLAFNSKIGKVTIANENEIIVLKRQPNPLEDFIIKIDQTKNSIPTTLHIALSKSSRSSVAIRIDPKDNLVKELKGIPRLFCDFPLIGTEKFYFPAIINSFYFNPQTERDGIWLKGNEDEEVQENQSILIESINLYEQLITILSKKGMKKLYHAVDTRIPNVNEERLDKEWYKTNIQKPLRELIIKIPLVDTIHRGKSAIDLKDEGYVDFPHHSSKKIREQLWSLGNKLDGSTLILPEKESIHNWNEIIWEEGYYLDIKAYASFFEEWINTLEEFTEILDKDENEFDWLNEFFEMIIDDELIGLFNEYKLVPNQNGTFNKVNEKTRLRRTTNILYFDEINDETLLKILKLLGEDWKENLIHPQIKVELTNAVLDKSDIASGITNAINNVKGDWDANSIKAVVFLTEWFEYHPDLGKDLFPELFKRRAELLMKTIDDKESLYHLMKSRTPLSTLSEIAIAIDNDPEILNIIKRREIELEEKERNKIGEVVETLLTAVLRTHGFKVNKTHVGKDLIITCKGKINYSIEVKSTSTGGFVSLTSAQANTAFQNPSNYSLCVVHKNGQDLTKEYVAKNARFVNNIGELIVTKVQDVQRFNNSQSTLTNEKGGIGILIENPLTLKYKVSSNIWVSGTNLLNFVEKIKTMNNQII